MWHLIHFPEQATVEDVMQLVFDRRSYDLRSRKRYFLSTLPPLTDQQAMKKARQSNDDGTRLAADVDCVEEEVISFTIDNCPVPTANDAIERDEHPSLASKLVQQCRQQKINDEVNDVASAAPNYPDEDFVPLLPVRASESCMKNQQIEEDDEDLLRSCPPHIDEMLAIVRNIRAQSLRHQQVPQCPRFGVGGAHSSNINYGQQCDGCFPTVASSSSSSSSSSALVATTTIANNTRESNYDMYCSNSY